MPFFFIPDKIEVTINLGSETLKAVNRIIDEVSLRKQVKQLAGELNASTDALKTTVDANPDPNPNN